ncbi:MAG: enoyl-CoA hydratase/isomerase family protein [Caulobacterales bacterium]|nr:enoyl-CoA hydratase/isomerase family protein [Caulobacterales bacterium]
MTDEVLFERRGVWGIVTINRPDALNAINQAICAQMRRTLLDWRADDGVRAVLVRGAGDRAFCAGGDIRWLHDAAKVDRARACEFFRVEYALNSLIHHYPKPYVAIINGVTMGGGVGLSAPGDFRLAGEKTMWAMPETGIGFFPDVGGGYLLPRLASHFGVYLALTGARLNAADCVAGGVATHQVAEGRMDDTVEALLESDLAGDPAAAIAAIAATWPEADPSPRVAPHHDEIARHFAGSSVEAILASLEGAASVGEGSQSAAFAADTLKLLRRMSPTSLKVTMEQIRRGAALAFDDVMRMEFRMAWRFMAGDDFFEGVRAQVIDKDRKPNWRPDAVAGVSDAAVAEYFAAPSVPELELPSSP